MSQEHKHQLDIMDGLRFGCGFYIASLLFSIALFILSFLVLALLGLLGGGFGALLQRLLEQGL